MTFGYGSPGFNPFHCPPCPPANICNTICLDPIDAPILIATSLVATYVLMLYFRVGSE